SSRRGVRSKAISSSSSHRLLFFRRGGVQRLGSYFLECRHHEILNRAAAKIACWPARYGPRAVSRLAVARYQHVGDLLKLRFPDLIANLLLPRVQFDPQP